MLDKLLDDHDRIRRLADDLGAFMTEDTAPVDPAFAQLRWTLIRELASHLAVEGQLITDAVRRKKITEGGRDDMFDLALADDVFDHVARWSDTALRADWPGYRRDVERILKRLHARMDREEAQSYPAIFHAETARTAVA